MTDQHTDTDPTPAHGTPRPERQTKTLVLDRQLREMRATANTLRHTISQAELDIEDATARLRFHQAKYHQLTSDINTVEQLIIDLSPEPRD